MQRSRLILALATAMALAACGGGTPPPAIPAPSSEPSSTASPAKPTEELKAPGEAGIGDRTTCLISGEAFTVTPKSPKVEYQGKTYYFCCGGCDSKFASDPEKYLRKKPSA